MGRRPVELSQEERDLLAEGLLQWDGPPRATDQLAQIMGFDDVKSLHREGARIAAELRQGVMLTAADLARALVATELAFSSDCYGAA